MLLDNERLFSSPLSLLTGALGRDTKFSSLCITQVPSIDPTDTNKSAKSSWLLFRAISKGVSKLILRASTSAPKVIRALVASMLSSYEKRDKKTDHLV